MGAEPRVQLVDRGRAAGPPRPRPPLAPQQCRRHRQVSKVTAASYNHA